MQPERLRGSPYNVNSDVWSLGVTLMELATGKFPFAHAGEILRPDLAIVEGECADLAIVELLEAIINEPLPKLDPVIFGNHTRDFVDCCLIRDPLVRPSPNILLVTITSSIDNDTDIPYIEASFCAENCHDRYSQLDQQHGRLIILFKVDYHLIICTIPSIINLIESSITSWQPSYQH